MDPNTEQRAEWVAAKQGYIEQCCRQKVGPRGDPGDLQSEVSMKLIKNENFLFNSEQAEAYTAVVVHTKHIDLWRADARWRGLEAEDTIAEMQDEHTPEPWDISSKNEDLETLQAALSELPTTQRDVIRLKLEGETFEGISKALGIAVSTAHLNYRKAVKALNRRLNCPPSNPESSLLAHNDAPTPVAPSPSCHEPPRAWRSLNIRVKCVGNCSAGPTSSAGTVEIPFGDSSALRGKLVPRGNSLELYLDHPDLAVPQLFRVELRETENDKRRWCRYAMLREGSRKPTLLLLIAPELLTTHANLHVERFLSASEIQKEDLGTLALSFELMLAKDDRALSAWTTWLDAQDQRNDLPECVQATLSALRTRATEFQEQTEPRFGA